MRKALSAILLVALGAAILVACGRATPSATSAPPQPTAAPSNTPTLIPPSATPAPPAVALIAAPNARPGVKNAVEQWLQALAEKQGYTFLQTNAKTLPPNTVLAVAVGGVPPKAGKARRIAVNPPPNANPDGAQTLSTAKADLIHRAFLAGYLASVITEDWRIGILADASEEKAVKAFKDGGIYYCGLCRPVHPPFFVYPQFAIVPAGAQNEEWAESARELVGAGKVRTLALSPLALKQMHSFPTLNANLIALPPTGESASGKNIAISVEANIAAALERLWEHPQEPSANAAMQIKVLKPNSISPGRLKWVQETQKALEEGLIAP